MLGTKYSLNVASNISSEEIDADADGEDSDLAAEYEENVASKVSRNVASKGWNKNAGAYLFDKLHASKLLKGTPYCIEN